MSLAHFENICFEDKKWIEPCLKKLGSSFSDLNFDNIFLFRHKHQFTLLKGSKSYVKGLTYDEKTYIFPLFSFSSLQEEDIHFMLSEAQMIFPVDKSYFDLFDDTIYEKKTLLQDSDYLYVTSELAELKGRKYQNKRHHSDYFRDNYDSLWHPLDASRLQDAINVVKNWSDPTQKDSSECMEALELFDHFKFQGIVLYVDDKPVGLIFGSELNENTFLVHFAKAEVEYKGIYQYLYQQFASQLLNYTYLNMEQDLGIDSLRKSKESYHPIEVLSKWRISLK